METPDLDQFDIIAYLEDRGLDYFTAGTKNTSAGWISMSCPFCGDRSNHLGINIVSKKYSCFKCGSKGHVINLIKEVDSVGYGKAVTIATGFVERNFNAYHAKYKNEYTNQYGDIRTNSETTTFPGNTSTNFLPIHDKFLLSRRYDRTYLQHKYGILAVGPTLDDWKFRILIPIFFNNEIMSYVGRDTTGMAKIKYKNCAIEKSRISIKSIVYGLDNVKDSAILVEGILDAWRIGFGAIATMGTEVTPEQLLLLTKLKRLTIMFDGDATQKAHKLAYQLGSLIPEVSVLELSEGDPDSELSENEIWDLRRECL